jgi:hypothetical protein
MSLLVLWIRTFVVMDCLNSMIKMVNRGIPIGKLESSTLLVLIKKT